MKKILLSIIFFIGLIPNLKDMCLESAYCAKGQGMYNEEGEYQCEIHAEQVCNICYECYDVMASFCPNCYFFCDVCKITWTMDAYHKHDTNGDGIFEDEDPDGTGHYEVQYKEVFICSKCRKEFEILDGAKTHAIKTGHTNFHIRKERIF